ncbi:MAG: hypothetical protein M3P13_13555 [Acidobacteriota bacterium]|nr:hypothetical protein [Acidobacteriota bacterium]
MRFTRDKRGYENTFVVHTGGGRRRGKPRARILYWFRTPPGVRIGRAALDEAAIRLIEEHNPDVEFDWTRILKGQDAPVEEKPLQQDRRGRQRPREFPPRSSPPRGPAPDAKPQGVDQTIEPAFVPDADPLPSRVDEPIECAGEELERLAEPGEGVRELAEGAGEIADRVDRLDVEEAAVERMDGEGGRVDEAAIEELLSDTPSEPQTENTQRKAATAAEARLGSEGLSRLRARYAEVLARISETITDPVRRDQLKSEAERLNPDTWVTDEEVSAGLEAYETVFESLRTVVGRRRRRRRRSGGRNRETGPTGSGQQPSLPDPAGGEEIDTNDPGEDL